MSSLNAKTYESAPSQNVAFLGLGVMGYPMAGHLARAGHAVTVYNRSAAKAAAWCQEFADSKQPAHAATPREAVKNADIIFCCVGNDEDLRAVVLGADGAFAGMKRAPSWLTTQPPLPTSRVSCMPPPKRMVCTSLMRLFLVAKAAHKMAC